MTAYEMRISDWSSDVCSSDLVVDHESDGQVSGQSPVHFHPLLRVGIQLRARHRVGSGSVVAHARRIRRLAAGQPGKQKKKDRRSRAHEPAHGILPDDLPRILPWPEHPDAPTPSQNSQGRSLMEAGKGPPKTDKGRLAAALVVESMASPRGFEPRCPP